LTQPTLPVHPQSSHGQVPSVTTTTVRVSVGGTHIALAWFLTAATFGYLLPWAVADLAAPPGWYPDATGHLQYWDGRAWAPPPPG
jgi:hypothetical protein